MAASGLGVAAGSAVQREALDVGLGRFLAHAGLVVDAELARNKDGAEIGADDGPEDGHGGADGGHVDFEDDEEDAQGPVPSRVVCRQPARLVVDGQVDAPDGECDNAVSVSVSRLYA